MHTQSASNLTAQRSSSHCNALRFRLFTQHILSRQHTSQSRQPTDICHSPRQAVTNHHIPIADILRVSNMASNTETVTAAYLKPLAISQTKATTPLRPPRSSSHSRRKPASSISSSIVTDSTPSSSVDTSRSTSSSFDELQKPYLHLLMPEPPSDHGSTEECHKAQCEAFLHILFRRRKNKDWRSLPVFPGDNEDFDSPLSPVRERIPWSTEGIWSDIGQKDVVDDMDVDYIIDGDGTTKCAQATNKPRAARHSVQAERKSS